MQNEVNGCIFQKMGSNLTNGCNLLFNPRRHSANTNRVLCAGDLMGICLQSHLQHQCGFHKYGYAHRNHNQALRPSIVAFLMRFHEARLPLPLTTNTRLHSQNGGKYRYCPGAVYNLYFHFLQKLPQYLR